MGPTDEQITETVERLAHGEFDTPADWPVCYELVRSEILRRNLPARDFAPSSQFGGSNWTVDDFTELADEWITMIRGERARRLTSQGRAATHIANTVRRMIYHFVLDQGRSTPQRDLWAALKETLPEYTELITGSPFAVPPLPDVPFPWQPESVRSPRRRAVTAPEVRAALAIIQYQQPVGWSVESLFNHVSAWSGVAGCGEQSLDAMDHFDEPVNKRSPEGADSAALGREAAQLVLRQLNEDERGILRGFIIPNGLGTVGLEDAARSLRLSKSTLHDRAGRLREKLASIEFDDLVTTNSEARRAFFAEILGEAGNTAGDWSIT